MRSKTVLSLAAFIIAFAFSSAFASLFIVRSYEPAAARNMSDFPDLTRKHPRHSCTTRVCLDMLEFLRNDIRNGDNWSDEVFDYKNKRNSLAFTVAVKSDAVEKYVNASSSMNDADFPADFREAWRDHMKAWRDYSEFLKKEKKSNPHGEFYDSIDQEKRAGFCGEISTTWSEVKRIGAEYNEDIRYEIR